MRKARFGGILIAALILAALATRPARAADEESLKGDEKELGDVKFCRLELPAKDLIFPLIWADDKGSAFYVVDAKGLLRKISFPEMVVKEKKDFGRKCSWLAMSAEGLLAAFPDVQEVWLFDPARLDTPKKKIAVPSLQRVVSAPSISIAVAGSVDKTRSGALVQIDLKTGKTTPLDFPRDPDNPRALIGKDRPIISPDGKYMFTEGYEQITRFAFSKGKWKYEESSPRIAQGPTRGGICVSSDSKMVSLPSGGGNYGAGYSTYVYPIDTFKKREATLVSGAYPASVGYDPTGGYMYTQNSQDSLILFSPTGIKKKEYKLGPGGLDVKQYLVYPGGNKVLIVMKDYVYYAETPSSK